MPKPKKDKLTLEQLEELVVGQFSPREQLELLARIVKSLGESITFEEIKEVKAYYEHQRREYALQVKKFLNMSKEMAARSIGEVNSAKDIRQIREERISRF